MTHPVNDPKLMAIVGQRPSPDHLWCDLCTRWEHGRNVNNTRPASGLSASALGAIGAFFYAIAEWFGQRAIYARARHLVRTGQGVGDPPTAERAR